VCSSDLEAKAATFQQAAFFFIKLDKPGVEQVGTAL
jgi:hypothetical protein